MPAPDVVLVAPYPTAGQRHAGPSGVASYAANLAHALSGRGACVEVIAPEEPEAPDEPRVSRDGPIVVRRAFRRGPWAMPAAAAAAREARAPVVHVQHEVFLYGGPTAVPGLVAALAGLRRHASTVVTMHQVVDTSEVDSSFTRLHRVRVPAPVARHVLDGIQRSMVALSDACIVHEEPFATAVPGTIVIPHGVEERHTPDRAEARGALGLDDRLVVLCFGFLAPYKGLELVLEAGGLVGGDSTVVVAAGGPHPRLASAGDRYGDELQARFAGPAARFTGWVDEADVARWFAAADVAAFAYPAPFSSSGALALAFAHSTPVLLSEPLAACVGASEELVMPADAPSLAVRLKELQDPATRSALATATAPLASARAWSTVAGSHLALYERLARS